MLQEKVKNIIVENQIWMKLAQNNMKSEPTNVSKENHHHSEVAADKLNFDDNDIGGRMMDDECKDIHEENHKRVEVVVYHGDNNVIGKTVRDRNDNESFGHG